MDILDTFLHMLVYFVHKNYDEAIVQLNKLAGTNIKDSTRSRVYFYIGECDYIEIEGFGENAEFIQKNN